MNIQRMGFDYEEMIMNLSGMGQIYIANDTYDLLPPYEGGSVPVTI
jgi:hypothetical protein